MYSNVDGSCNTAIGYKSLYSNTGYWNTAIGYEALFNTTESRNTAIGHHALYTNIDGSFNTAIGMNTLYFNIANYNTAIGDSAMYRNIDGSHNTAIGFNALHGNTGGSNNISVGYNAGNTIVGDNNIMIGNIGISTDENTIRIGVTGMSTFLPLTTVDISQNTYIDPSQNSTYIDPSSNTSAVYYDNTTGELITQLGCQQYAVVDASCNPLTNSSTKTTMATIGLLGKGIWLLEASFRSYTNTGAATTFCSLSFNTNSTSIDETRALSFIPTLDPSLPKDSIWTRITSCILNTTPTHWYLCGGALDGTTNIENIHIYATRIG
jgi:hypothetical protein